MPAEMFIDLYNLGIIRRRISQGNFNGPHSNYLIFVSFITAGLMFQRDIGGENPLYFGTRTISIAIALSTLIIMSTYTTALTANKVVHTSKTPITGFKDDKVRNTSIPFY